jgi:hypothetical protein
VRGDGIATMVMARVPGFVVLAVPEFGGEVASYCQV